MDKNYKLYHIFIEVRGPGGTWTTKVNAKTVENAIINAGKALMRKGVEFNRLQLVGEPIAIDRSEPMKNGYSKQIKNKSKWTQKSLDEAV